MKYATDLAGLRKETFYNTVRKCDYSPSLDYLDGLEIISCDYNELCNWMGKNTIGNPFTGSEKVEFNARINYSSRYTDIMLFKKANETAHKEVS